MQRMTFAEVFNIEMISVDSTAIRAFGYGNFTKELLINFHPNLQGQEYLYTYKNVPQDIVTQFKIAESKGEFYNREIKNRYDCTRITLT
jgi:KTSC domain